MTAPTPEVTIVGAGMAGMTAALRLLEAGWTVKVIEASPDLGGKFGARRAKGVYHDFAWHIFADWCLNFWDVAGTIGVSRAEGFVPRPRMSLVRPLEGRSRWPRVATVSSIGSFESFWSDATSGTAHWSDVMLYTYALYALLCDQDLEREEFLNRVEVNGYVRSLLPYSSDVAALLHNELLLRVWAIPSYLISARSYQKHLQLIEPFRSSPSSLCIMRKNFHDGFWEPFHRTLRRFGPRFTLALGTSVTGIRLAPGGDRVQEILVRRAGEAAARPERVQTLIVAVPPERLLDIVAHAESRTLRDRVPTLLDLEKLPSHQTSALTLFFKRRIDVPGVGDVPVALIEDLETIYSPDTRAQRNGLASTYGLSFIEVGRLWGADHPMVLSVLASDAEALARLDPDEACGRVVAELGRYVRFDDRDVDWGYSHFQSHRGERLFVNAVGSWEYRPEVRVSNARRETLTDQLWRTVGNLYLAGDYCRSQVDFVSLEGAVHTGMWAAHALGRNAEAAGRRGPLVPPPVPPVSFDRARAEEIKARVERWAGLAARRSRLVKAELQAAARQRHQDREPAARPAPARPITPMREEGGVTMSEALNTSPGFARPFSTKRTEWLERDYRDVMTPIILRTSGVGVTVPLLFWEVQALCVDGTADADAVDGLVLARHGLRAQHRDPENPLLPQPGSGRAHVQVWAPDYGGTTVGPIKAVYAGIYVEARRPCRDDHPDEAHMFWWWYYSNSSVNQEFKQDVWGIPNLLGAIETAYLTPTKEVRLLDDGRLALRIRLDTGGLRPIDRDERLIFRTVAQRSTDDGENRVMLQDYGPLYTRPAKPGDLYRGKGTEVDRQLAEVDFTHLASSFFGGYNGVVEMYDDQARAELPGAAPADEMLKIELPVSVLKDLARGVAVGNGGGRPARRRRKS